MDFNQFAEMHGLMIGSLVMDRWVRVSTQDKPHKKNGSYIWYGMTGAIMNWAVHDKPIQWRSREPYRPDPLAKAKRDKQIKEREERQSKAMNKANYIIENAVLQTHKYLNKKGFQSKGLVWNNLLVIPMRINDKIVGCQLIDPEGSKRFLKGQITKGASFKMGDKGVNILVEGMATGLSVRRAMKELKQNAVIHVCFSASNMIEISKNFASAIVVADNDDVGINTAKKIGFPYWVSDVRGFDFNDAEKKDGTKSVSQSLLGLLKTL